MHGTFRAQAEWHSLEAARVHAPGLETWGGALDPSSNLFEAPLAPDQARCGHQQYVETLDAAGVEVHRLADDLARGGQLDGFVRDRVTVTEGVDLDATLSELSSREKLQLGLARAELSEGQRSPVSVTLRAPISNMYFQRDTTILGDSGPILCRMASTVRKPEVEIVRRAWESIGASIVHEATTGPIEGGEFIPAGEFALLGVSGIVDGKEEIVRTSYAAGRELLEDGALGYDEVGLVRAPIEREKAERERHGGPSRMMHLLGWFNIAAEGLAVTFEGLAEAAKVDVFERNGEEYRHRDSLSLLTYLEEKDFTVVDAHWDERWPTNFVAVDDGVIIPLFEPDEQGAYRPEHNPTIETLSELGISILPDGTGLPNGPLTDGAGGFHCMTTPLNREP